MKKVNQEDRINKQTLATMISKACSSALAGLPMSIVLNIIITVPVTVWALDYGLNALHVALLLSAPFFGMSVFRQTLIDYVYAIYNIDINPSTLIKKLIKKVFKK